ncbi:unnamed protein product [Echinostoma caproni]|uniref:Thyrotropin-releasing hormone receptor n=1 Tax=Echinostoma caproni TaxID=27848 RepID=A0A183B3E6_9TREM|nr:unnamed protein product [Echinostoma caproni]
MIVLIRLSNPNLMCSQRQIIPNGTIESCVHSYEHSVFLNPMDMNSTDYSSWNDTLTFVPYSLFYYSFIYRIVGTVALAFILTVGLIGNGLVILVVVMSPGLHTPTNCYLVSLSASDLIVLLSTTTLTMKEFYMPVGQWDLGQTVCQIAVCIQYLAAAVSALSICAFSIERWVGICYPIRAQYICTVNRAVRIISGIWIFSSLYNMPWLFMTSTIVIPSGNPSVPPYEKCTFRFPHTAYQVVYTADFILFYVVPLLVTSIMYIQICWFLFRGHEHNLTTLTNATRPVVPTAADCTTNTMSTALSQQHIQMCHLLSRVRARKQERVSYGSATKYPNLEISDTQHKEQANFLIAEHYER